MAATFDGAARLILLDGATQENVQEIYSRWVDWVAAGTNSRFPLALKSLGDPAGVDGYALPVIAFLVNGWRVRPAGQATTSTVEIGGGILVGPGGADPFAPVLSGVEPRIRYAQPVQAIAYSTGGAAGAPTAQQIAAATLAAATATPIHADVQRVNNIKIVGTGVTGDSMRPAP
jgi:hypothetical protein